MSFETLGFAEFFGMKRVPFTSSLETEYLNMSTQFQDTLGRLEYAAKNSLFAVLTGGVGYGKSTVLRAFADSLDKDKFNILYISESNLTPRWLYSIPLAQFGIKAKYYTNDAKRQFHDVLLSESSVRHKQVVMIIDEAHLVSLNHAQRTLQEVRFLLNCKFDSGNPLSLILAGQSELWDILNNERSRAITQRIDLVCKLTALDEQQVFSYIASHLRYAEVGDSIFSNEAIKTISLRSNGVPRLINKICTHTLLYAACRGTKEITSELVEEVIEKEIPPCILN